MSHPNLHSTMYLFQPFSESSLNLFRNIYIPLCIYFNTDVRLVKPLAVSFTFHYVSISTELRNAQRAAASIIYIPLCIYFNQPSSAPLLMEVIDNLHSTMYLFQLQRWHYDIQSALIYIPLCIYFNPDLQKPYIYYNNRCTSVDQADINYIYIDMFRQYLD